MFDTHAHLFKEYYSCKEIDDIVKNFDGTIIVSGTDNKTNREIMNLNYDNVYITLGIHPDDVNNYCCEDLKYIENNLSNNKVVGIGEIGLDYHYSKDDKDKQIELFIKQLDLARKYNMPVVIHSRDAINDTLEILKNYKDLKKILHCYSGSLESAREFMKINTFFGVGGVLTFKNSTNLVQTIKNIPIENIVIETDSPYLSPFRGNVNVPSNVREVMIKLASIKDMTYDDVLKITSSNAMYIFERIKK